MYDVKDLKNSRIIRIFIITLSDRASKGLYEDSSGEYILDEIKGFLESLGWKTSTAKIIIPDNSEQLLNAIQTEIYENKADIIFTCGGTGIGSKDITTDTVKPLLTKEIPGIMEYIRVKYGNKIPNALLSRGVCGLINNTLVYTIPGSLNAAKSYIKEIKKTIEHIIFMISDIDTHTKH